MLTRCPSPTCRQDFDLPCSTDRANGSCPACGQAATFRPLELAHHVDKVYGHKLASGDTIENLAAAKVEQATLSVLVEDVRSLWNVGSIFRTSDGAGFSQLYLSGITGCPPRKEIAKTSLGAEESVAWCYCRNALEVLPALRAAGVLVVGLECSDGSISLAGALAKHRLTVPLCLVVGNEVNGLSAESISLCDLICHLPMRGKKESLNVAVAFGIAAYTIAEHLLSQNDQSHRLSDAGLAG